MTNLLAETLEIMARSEHTPEDVVYVGSVYDNPHGCSWSEFEQLADVEYDAGYGGAEVAEDLMVIFSDGSWLERGEYDGSEWWEFKRSPRIPDAPAPIVRVVRGDNHWSKLAEMNAPSGVS